MHVYLELYGKLLVVHDIMFMHNLEVHASTVWVVNMQKHKRLKYAAKFRIAQKYSTSFDKQQWKQTCRLSASHRRAPGRCLIAGNDDLCDSR